MAELKTTYMGLEIKSPILVGSSGLTYSVDGIKRLADAGAGAVVLKSIFEEQILIESDHELNEVQFHPEGADYFDVYVKEHHLSQYLELVSNAKKAVDIPIIASINCMTPSDWTGFAKKLQQAGADGLELNYFVLPSDPVQDGLKAEETLFKIVRQVLKTVDIPVSVKLSSYFTNFANTLSHLSNTGIKGIVLFNRFYTPDVDIDKLELRMGNPFSAPEEALTTLRWMAIASGFVQCDLAASTGIYNGEMVIKQLLAGATAVQMVSSVYKNHAPVIGDSLKTVSDWMDKKGFSSIEQFRGRLSQKNVENPAFFERVQFLKHYGKM